MDTDLDSFIKEYSNNSSIFTEYVNDPDNDKYKKRIIKLTDDTKYLIDNPDIAKKVIDKLITSKDEGVLSQVCTLGIIIDYKKVKMYKMINKIIENNQDNFLSVILTMRINNLNEDISD